MQPGPDYRATDPESMQLKQRDSSGKLKYKIRRKNPKRGEKPGIDRDKNSLC